MTKCLFNCGLIASAVFASMSLAMLNSSGADASVGPGPLVGLYQVTNFGGCAYFVDTKHNIPNFKGLKFNDTGNPNNCNSIGPNDRTSSVATQCTIVLYVDKNYSGAHDTFTNGTYTSVPHNDQYSSMKMGACG